MKKQQIIHTSGKRKTAIARASLRPGKGIIRINDRPLDLVTPKMVRFRILEPLALLDKGLIAGIDCDIHVRGGGMTSQTDAIRIAISRALCEYAGGAVRETLVSYDRTLLVADTRIKEKRKPNCQGQARSRRQKSYR